MTRRRRCAPPPPWPTRGGTRGRCSETSRPTAANSSPSRCWARCRRSCGSPLSATAVRLLDLVSAALEATANGAQARIQLELLLVKAAAPQFDPSLAALLARIERLEAGARRGSGPAGVAEIGRASCRE